MKFLFKDDKKRFYFIQRMKRLIGIFIPFMICQSVFISAIIENNLFYECSDDLTNELLNHENKNTKKTIIYGAINLAADCLIIIPLLFLAIKIICEDGSTICAEKKSKPIKEPKINPDPEKKIILRFKMI